MTANPVTGNDVAEALRRYRQQQPLTQCLTNIVVAQWTANVVLAAGASPAMVDNPREARLFAGVASGVLINLGTPYAETADAMGEAAEGAQQAGTAWVLDPIAAGALPWRTDLAHDLLAFAPTIVRGNASEIDGLAGGEGGKGADSSADSCEVVDIAKELACQHGCVVAVSGRVDQLTDGERLVQVHNGHELLTRVTGVGCALGALMAGFAGVVDDALLAAAAATALLTIAGDHAAENSSGPGSFAVALLDELAAITPEQLAREVRL